MIIFNDTFANLFVSSMDWVCTAFIGAPCVETEFGTVDEKFLLRKIVNIFFALSAIAASALLFQCFCPHEVKKFGDVETYVAATTKVYHHEFNRKLWNVLSKEAPKEIERVQGRFDRDKEFNRPQASEMFDRDMLYLWFERQNDTFPIIRWACFSLLVIGSTLLAYPTIAMFGEVLSIAWTY